MRFESIVNSDRFKTDLGVSVAQSRFESIVNSDRFKTQWLCDRGRGKFESIVNSDRFKTTSRGADYLNLFESIVNSDRFKTKTHEFVDMIAKISADKGVSFNFTDNQKLKESGFAIDGKTVNGYVQGKDITLNVNSAKALNKVVGHEITHVLEGTELYSELQAAVKAYAETKGEYQSRYDTLTELYKGQDADIEAELTADLVGDYLFTDEKFIKNLSTEQPNIFKKIYDEIKYLVKTVTSGSKEAKQLEQIKKVFDKAYKENSHVDSKPDSDVKYAISEKYNTEFDVWFNNTTESQRRKDGGFVNIGTTPNVLKNLGAPEGVFKMGKSKIQTILDEHSEMTPELIKKIPYMIENPVLIMESLTRKDSVVVYGQLYTKDNKPIMASVLITNNKNGESVVELTVITSSYARSYGKKDNNKDQSLIDRSKILYINPNKKITDSWLKSLGLQLPSDITNYGYINMLTHSTQNVNSDNNGVAIRNSLSGLDEDIAPIGTFNTYGKDIAFKAPTAEDLATSQEVSESKAINLPTAKDIDALINQPAAVEESEQKETSLTEKNRQAVKRLEQTIEDTRATIEELRKNDVTLLFRHPDYLGCHF